MYGPRLELDGFELLARPEQKAVLRVFLEGLVLANLCYLRAHPETPPLYAAGVRYEKEPGDRDNWQNVPRTLHLLNGDCEDLASWRCAELRFHGEHQAACEVEFYESPHVVDMHIVVRRADGSREDPSRKLGMP